MALDVGEGVYGIVEASSLTGVSAPRIRRWFRGYETGLSLNRYRMPPVLKGDSREVDGHLQLSFLDLLEVRLIDGFLDFGVHWKELRQAASAGVELLGSSHPFTKFKFRTDGRRMFADIDPESKDSRLIQLRDHQQVFRSVVSPMLIGVEFDATQAIRWWPLGEGKSIVIDPKRSFGRPIAASSGIPAMVLAMHALSHGVDETSDWYCATVKEVKDAVRFAKKFAA